MCVFSLLILSSLLRDDNEVGDNDGGWWLVVVLRIFTANKKIFTALFILCIVLLEDKKGNYWQ